MFVSLKQTFMVQPKKWKKVNFLDITLQKQITVNVRKPNIRITTKYERLLVCGFQTIHILRLKFELFRPDFGRCTKLDRLRYNKKYI